jgi:hypothetical protein
MAGVTAHQEIQDVVRTLAALSPDGEFTSPTS